MKIRGLAVLFVMMLVGTSACVAEAGYFQKLGNTFVRGMKNVVSAPYEIPYTIGQYDHKQDGNSRAIRDITGFFDGTFRTVTRFGCGAWDMVWSMVPGDQNGLPIEPETFFNYKWF